MGNKYTGKVYALGDAIGGFGGTAVHDVEVLKNAIKSNKVPLLSSFENINDPINIIGHCELEVRDDAIYATAEFIGPYAEAFEHTEILDDVRLGFYANGCDISKDKVVKSMTIRSVALTRTCLGGKLKKEE